jgi:hypothetical protein
VAKFVIAARDLPPFQSPYAPADEGIAADC